MSENDLDYGLTISSARSTYLNKHQINTNALESSKFLMVTHNLPYLNFFSQSALLPSVAATEVPFETPLSTVYFAGDKLQYEPISISFLIDEDMKVWEELYNWMKGYAFPHSEKEYSDQKKRGIYSDMSLIFLKNSFASNLVMRFYNCWPTFLGPVQFTSTDSGPGILQTDVTIRYDTFKIIRIAQ